MRAKIIFLIALFQAFGAYAQGSSTRIDSDTIIHRRDIIDSLTVASTVNIENRGKILGDIFVNRGLVLHLRNSGVISGTINLGEYAQLVQVIETAADITRLAVNGRYSIQISGRESLNLSDILKISNGADRIVLNSASISIDGSEHSALHIRSATQPASHDGAPTPVIELIGEINVRISNLAAMRGKLIMANVSGDGVVNVIIDEDDMLYAAYAVRRDENIYLDVMRVTEYAKIIGDDMDDFVDWLRNENPDDKTVNALDNADDMKQFSNIIGRSAALSPINLMRPVRTFNRTQMMPTPIYDTDVGTDAIYITSNYADVYAAKIGAYGRNEKLRFGASAYSGAFSYKDDINDFSGYFYGANLRADWNDKSMYVHSIMGFTSAAFTTSAVFDGKSAAYNPKGFSAYGVIDAGLKYYMSDGFYAAPFIGAGAEFNKVLHQSQTDGFARAGATLGFSESMTMGMKYDYAAFVLAQSNDVMSVGISMKFLSEFDDMGGEFSYALVRDEFDISHKFSIGLNFSF